MNKKKIFNIFLAASIIIGSAAFKVSAEMPSGTAVIGDKAYALNYLMNASEEDNEQIRMEIIKGTEIYVKDFGGNWVYNSSNLTILNAKDVIPAVEYKDEFGNITNYEPGDGDEDGQEELEVIDIT